MATSSKPVTRPVARLDASLLLARKGEALPAIAATQHNNPGLVWGAQPHPEDFQPHAFQPQHNTVQASRPQQPTLRAQPAATARLRKGAALFGGRTSKTPIRQNPHSQMEEVVLSLRLEDKAYLRLKYLAQKSGLSTQKILREALSFHLVRKGVPRSRKISLNTEKTNN